MKAITRAAVVATALAAGPAAALTVFPECTGEEATIEAAVAHFNSLGTPVAMVHGRFSATEVIEEDQYGADGEKTWRRVRGKMRGKTVGAQGFSVPFSAPVMVEQECDNGSCTPSFDNTQWLAFLVKMPEQGYSFLTSDMSCVPSGFRAPDAALLNRALECLKGDCK